MVGSRVGAEGGAVVGVEAVQCLDKSECGDLLQVLERHPVAAVKAPRDRVGEREMGSDQAFTRVRVAVFGVGLKVCRLVARAARSPGRRPLRTPTVGIDDVWMLAARID